jgi:hypothetical protein
LFDFEEPMNTHRSHFHGLMAAALLSGIAASDLGAWGSGPIRRYPRKKYENAANKQACAKRRAKNKAARKSRQRNRP